MNATLFHAWDKARRLRGDTLGIAGLDPIETPHEVIYAQLGARLRRYALKDDVQSDGPKILIVPAPIKRHYIWDLLPSCSVVRHALARGMDVYLLEWTQAPTEWGLDESVNAIAQCVSRIESTGGDLPHVFGHSLGGTLAALYAARHPQRLASLVLVEAPLHFGEDAGAFAPLLAYSPTGAALHKTFGDVPGTVLNMAAVCASPREFLWERQLDAMAALFRGGEVAHKHALATRWTFDEMPMPGRLFEQVVDDLYREDRFMRATLIIQERKVAPRDIKVPLAVVIDPFSAILPAAAILDFVKAVPGRRKYVLRYVADEGVVLRHLGALIGATAHREVWPQLFHWIQEVDTSLAAAQPS
ncbi:MAG TPA: alpha/beta fold hydrolase [Burkholderiaceae bacterium]|nr:alpha/beta fold hydrolase [Burkholderiaceae bacterium]